MRTATYNKTIDLSIHFNRRFLWNQSLSQNQKKGMDSAAQAPSGSILKAVMTDVHTREQRSRNMSAIRGRNTKPEVRVRSVLHGMGFRFRLHRKDLPGKPDIVLRSEERRVGKEC